MTAQTIATFSAVLKEIYNPLVRDSLGLGRYYTAWAAGHMIEWAVVFRPQINDFPKRWRR